MEQRKMSKKHMGSWEGETEQMEETPGTDSEHGLENVWYSFHLTLSH